MLRRLALIALAAGVAFPTSAARATGDAAAGEALFKRCAICHSFDPAAKKAGPHLADLIGRQAGSVPGFAYSQGLAQSGIVWSPETLEAYLAAPRKLVPGTKMGVGVPDAKDREDLIAYLLSLGP